jgi:hypothetical protein
MHPTEVTAPVVLVWILTAVAVTRPAADSLSVEGAPPSTLIIQGTIRFNSTGKLYVLLTNESLFEELYRGVRQRVIDPDSTALREGRQGFEFENVSPGTYALRCFQDENGNQELDMGWFGPTEPWGMSWNDKRPLGIPRFHHCSFELVRDTTDIVLELR